MNLEPMILGRVVVCVLRGPVQRAEQTCNEIFRFELLGEKGPATLAMEAKEAEATTLTEGGGPEPRAARARARRR